MTRERLIEGILQSVATVVLLPQVRPVIEVLWGISLLPELYQQKAMAFFADFIIAVPQNLCSRSAQQMQAAMDRYDEFWRPVPVAAATQGEDD